MLAIILAFWVPVFGPTYHITEGSRAYPTKAECDKIVSTVIATGRFGDPKQWSCKQVEKAPDPLPEMPGMQHNHK